MSVIKHAFGFYYRIKENIILIIYLVQSTVHRPAHCGYLKKLLGAITQLVVRDWNACGEGRGSDDKFLQINTSILEPPRDRLRYVWNTLLSQLHSSL